MQNILKPYVEQVIKDQNLPADQKCILLIDCYPVHIGEEFRTYVFVEFPNVFLIFVSANCMQSSSYSHHFEKCANIRLLGTGLFQPADVGLQHVIKHDLHQAALQFLVDSHAQQLDSGLTPEQVKFTTSLPVLRDASVQPIVNTWQFLHSSNGRDLIQKVGSNLVA